MGTKKELKESYKNRKPDMGIFKIECRMSGNCYLFESKDLRSQMNRFQFQLNMGSHPNRELQKEWKEQGAAGFILEVLERLEYDGNKSKNANIKDLEFLYSIWTERLLGARPGKLECQC